MFSSRSTWKRDLCSKSYINDVANKCVYMQNHFFWWFEVYDDCRCIINETRSSSWAHKNKKSNFRITLNLRQRSNQIFFYYVSKAILLYTVFSSIVDFIFSYWFKYNQCTEDIEIKRFFRSLTWCEWNKFMCICLSMK